MKIVIILISSIAYLGLYSQYNYIKNNGFDVLINPNKVYYSLPDGMCAGDVDDCEHWKTRTYKYNACQSICGSSNARVLEHSPDLFGKNCGTTSIPFKGDYCVGAGVGNKEMFQQVLKKNLIPGVYVFSGFVKRATPYVGQDILSLYFNNKLLKFDCEDDCSSFVNQDDCYHKFEDDLLDYCVPDYETDYSYSNSCMNRFNAVSWHNYNYEFNLPFKPGTNTLSIIYQGFSKDEKFDCYGTNDYSYFDELSLQRKSCFCIDDLWIENRIIKSGEIIQSNKSLRFGYNVENVTENGDVIFDGTDIILRSKSIKLEPGSKLMPGSSINFRFDDCQNKFQGLTPSIAFFSNAALMTSTNPLNYNWTLYGSNATDYYIQIFDRWGSLVAEQAGQFNSSNYALITPPYHLDGIKYTYQLWVYNCEFESQVKSGSIDMYKSTRNNDQLCKIFPNPTKNYITLTINELNSDDIIEVGIFDLNGKKIDNVVLNERVIKGHITQTIPIHNLQKGFYILNVLKNNELLSSDKIFKEI